MAILLLVVVVVSQYKRDRLATEYSFILLGPISGKSRELFGPGKQVVKLQSACFEKLIFFNMPLM